MRTQAVCVYIDLKISKRLNVFCCFGIHDNIITLGISLVIYKSYSSVSQLEIK